MKLSKKQIAKESQSPAKLKTGVVQIHSGKSTNKTRGQCPKSAEKTKKILKIEPVPEKTLHPSAKIKLQLFPVDDVTQRALEKDGFHPYLELTLSARKKISSVVKHLNYKWGGSSIAHGEPALFPYISFEDFASHRWTLIDDNVTAGDVYMSIGSPSTFRLRYGWLSSDWENKSFVLSSTSTPFKSISQPEGMQHGCCNNLKSTSSKQKQAEVTSEDLNPTVLSGSVAEDASGVDKMPSDGLVEPMASSLWDDSLTNISIGGLLSEASLQGRFSNCNNPKSDGSNAGLQPPQLNDSFDAFLITQSYSQAPRLPPHGSTSSILDAEDTCHAFPFQKNSSTGLDATALGGTAYSYNCSQDSVFKSSKHPNISEVNVQPSLLQGRDCQESETDLSLCSRIYQDESSLGLSGIKWTDSLGPFDLLPSSSSRKVINGDSLSMSRIFS
ncbi:TSL-kinase interacting protein 1 isoform X2 [Euphorbia lathyris]|uniref:TSL-kinase interacting protein 1 isoform X2 n=1 Tax=Euphorbia lathyris TaxID=212925 RepID=UPI0033138EC0